MNAIKECVECGYRTMCHKGLEKCSKCNGLLKVIALAEEE